MVEVVPLEVASERITAASAAATEYVSELSSIRDDLDSGDTGTTLGTMVAAQIQMTETETQYMVKAGIPKKVSGAVQAAAQDVKKAAG
jgi:hypothetical protein